jgi:hypothetical protein
MSGSFEGDPEGGKGPRGVAGVVTEGGGEVDWPRRAEQTDGEVAQAGHVTGARAGPDVGAVLGEGDIADVVRAALDRPVPSEVVSELGRAGLLEGNAGDRVDRHGPPPLGIVPAQVPDLA